jgi:hypothetical protein
MRISPVLGPGESCASHVMFLAVGIVEKNILSPVSRVVLVCGALVVLASFAYRVSVNGIGHDQYSYLLEAQHLLAGDTLYGPHLSETNPPLIIWFSAVPVLLASWSGGSAALFLRLLVIAMIFLSAAWCARIARFSTLRNPAAIVLLGLAILAIELSIGGDDFGQREHLLMILLLPYVFACASGSVVRLPLAERCALGMAAGIALWFKPQQVIILVALELFLAIRVRSLRRLLAPELVSLVSSSLILLALALVFTPLYFTGTVPLLLDTYWALGTTSTLVLALSLRHYTFLALTLVAACAVLPRFLRDSPTAAGLILCSVAASIAYDIQHTTWRYHAYPHWALLQLAWVYLLIDLFYPILDKFTSNLVLGKRTYLATSGLMAVLLCVIAIHPRLAFPRPDPPPDVELDRFLAQLPPSTTVSVISTSVGPLGYAYNHGLHWGSRFAHLWMMPAIIQNEMGPTGAPAPFKRLSPARLAGLAALQRAETAEDLIYFKPSVVIVQRCSRQHPCQGIEGKDFDMLSWFLQSPEFAAAWSPYQEQPPIQDFDIYKLAR